MNNNSKVCKDCKLEKPFTEFYKHSNTKDKHGIYCKSCNHVRSRKASIKYRNTEKGKEKHRLEERKRRSTNLEHVRKLGVETNKRYRANNKEVRKISISASQHKRRAQKLNNGKYEITKKFLEKLYNSECIYCGDRNNINADHVVPLSKGGTNSEGNLQPLCGSCNSSKGNKLMIEWVIYMRKGNNAKICLSV
jgi:5-methylcytosine-specific restriction endonuclease McrA